MSSGDAVIIVCTRDRPAQLARALAKTGETRPDAHVLVWDASSDESSASVCRDVAAEFPQMDLTYRRAERVGLARQRNDAAQHALEAGYSIVHFIDDDTLPYPGYFSAIEERFTGDPRIGGVGGVSQHSIRPRWLRVKRFFLIDGGRPGSVMRSGRPVHGQSLDLTASDDVDWLVGASMSWRREVLGRFRFDDRMEGRSLGEDLVFSYAVGREYRLVVEPRAKCLHDELGSSGGDPRALAIERVTTLHRWVRETGGPGLSVWAFWWSVLGELLLYGAVGALRKSERRQWQRAVGTAVGVKQVVLGRSALRRRAR